jgi:hypothetical protein
LKKSATFTLKVAVRWKKSLGVLIRGHKAEFSLFLVISKSLFVEKEGEGFVVFLNHCGGNLTTIIITIKDF